MGDGLEIPDLHARISYIPTSASKHSTDFFYEINENSVLDLDSWTTLGVLAA